MRDFENLDQFDLPRHPRKSLPEFLAMFPHLFQENAGKTPEQLAREAEKTAAYLKKHDEHHGIDMSDDAIRHRLHLNVSRSGQ